MARRLRGFPWSDVTHLIPGAVVSDPVKVLYVPVPKAACSSLKRLIADAAGTYDESALLRLTTPNITPDQAIHELEVNGFTYFRNLPDAEQNTILESGEWWRVGAVRNPYARAYSAFENNWLQFAGTMRQGLPDLYREVTEEGRLDLTESFLHFLRAMNDNRELFFRDDHFRPQSRQVGLDEVAYTHFFKVEEPGAIDAFARELSARAVRDVIPRRINEGFGVKYREVFTAEAARLVETIYVDDFAALGYPREEFPDSREHLLLTERETRLLGLVQRMWVRQWQMSVAAKALHGFRYGAREIGGRIRDKALAAVGRPRVVPEEGDT